jgi:hypothetical protein
MYQWKVNNVNSGTNSAVFLWTPVAGDLVKCVMTSSALCPSGPATSNAVSVSIVAAPPTPVQGSHIPGLTTVQWSWAPVTGATGYKWNTTNSYATATDMGTATTKYESGLTCGTTYTRYVWAYNTCLGSAVTILTQATLGCPPACGTPVTVNHSAGLVAPVTKTVTYASVTNIPGEPTKCWITRNLGASQQALSYDDGSEASAGWYWQFNRKQGYRHDGANVTPAWTITNIYENSGWVASNDPCSLELGAIWRIPTFSEYSNIDNGGGWTNWTGPYASALKLHAAGCIGYSSGSLYSRGSSGYYWCSEQTANNNASGLTFYTGGSYMNPYSKAYGFPVRCLHE